MWLYLPAPSVLYKKFQQDTKDEIPQEVLYWGRLTQYLKQKTPNVLVTQSWLMDMTNLNYFFVCHVTKVPRYAECFYVICIKIKKQAKNPKQLSLKTKIKQIC